MTLANFQAAIGLGIPALLPPMPYEDPSVSRAPARPLLLDEADQELAVNNALRYFQPDLHPDLAPEFARELITRGRIYMHRFRPDYPMHARPIGDYPGSSLGARAVMLMIQNNLDPRVAQHPYELVTYGGNGAVFQNWAQYLRTMQLLSQMTDEQTLVMSSGHPMGLFASHPEAPRVIVTNGMVIPNHSSSDDYLRLAALGVTSYGQMTAGSYMYIGPQGIVHGTTLTLLNAARLYLGLSPDQNLAGRVFVTSGLGGMSGAQAKAAVIAGAVGVIAEINPKAAQKRKDQGWVQELTDDLDTVLRRIDEARRAGAALSLGYVGNVVDLWKRLAAEGVAVDLGSDQTSLHLPYSGGYYPAGLSLEASMELIKKDPARFKELVHASLREQVVAIHALVAGGMHFWDYGNGFLRMAGIAGADVFADGGVDFKLPSYVEHIMGPLCFDYGFGPFRWVCTSGDPEDLRKTDRIAAEVIEALSRSAPAEIQQQYLDNLLWIRDAERHQLVVGSQARILYSDLEGRRRIALAFNKAIRDGVLQGPVVLGRDHHDVSGTDSPFRETADIRDGSRLTADMAVHNALGLGFRGATWLSLHNGGGVGWGEVINGGFGMVLDGSAETDRRIEMLFPWDVGNGLVRRAWARNRGARSSVERAMAADPRLQPTLPHEADASLVSEALERARREARQGT